MSALTNDQFELLERARDAKFMWGGGVPLASLQGEVELLLALRLIEPAGLSQYRLIGIGDEVLSATARGRPAIGPD
jgi:hypothetical protein